MRKLASACLIAVAATAAPQTPSKPEQAIAWLTSQWARIQREGRPAAQRMVAATPERFRDIARRTAGLTKKLQEMADPKTLADRRTLLLELWRVRGALDIVALLDPANIEQLTGVDIRQFASLRVEFERSFRTWNARLQR